MGRIFSSRKQSSRWGFPGKEWSTQGLVQEKQDLGRRERLDQEGGSTCLEHVGTSARDVEGLPSSSLWEGGGRRGLVWPREPRLLAVCWAEGVSSAWSSDHGPSSRPHDRPGPGGLGWRPLGVNGKAADREERWCHSVPGSRA